MSVTVLGLLILGTTVCAQTGPSTAGGGSGQVIEAKQITKTEAEKKYPPPSSGYPTGERDPHQASGIVSSPYPPHQEFDCSKVAHGGLVLDTRANKVFVMEPQFNPAAEAQAVERVHRLGQTRDVEITRYIMHNSFEESMLNLQQKKKDLLDLSFNRNAKMDKAEQVKERLESLRSLFR